MFDKLTVEWNARGQPLNNKGGNTLVSYIGVVVPQNITIKFKHWSDNRLNVAKDIIWKDITATFDVDEEHKDYIMKSAGKALREFRTNCGKCHRDAEGNVNLNPPAKYANLIDEADWIEFVNYRTKGEKFLKISEQNRKRTSNPIYPYRASRMGYRGVEEKIVTRTKRDTFECAVDLDVLWVDARKNKQGVVDNEKVQEAVNRVPKLATSHEPKLATSLEPKLATSLEPKLATSLDPKLATSLEPKLATSLEPKLATSLEPKLAISLEPKLATLLEPKFATLLEPKSLTNHGGLKTSFIFIDTPSIHEQQIHTIIITNIPIYVYNK
ncbi:hypothetical protein Lal_00031998 [Lupinus albus]|nr:hypothetical protein Lal_00031998 [Lupinus albus]